MAAGDHTGRFSWDDTFRKWFLRIFATIGVLTVVFVIVSVLLFVAGVKAVL